MSEYSKLIYEAMELVTYNLVIMFTTLLIGTSEIAPTHLNITARQKCLLLSSDVKNPAFLNWPKLPEKVMLPKGTQGWSKIAKAWSRPSESDIFLQLVLRLGRELKANTNEKSADEGSERFTEELEEVKDQESLLRPLNIQTTFVYLKAPGHLESELPLSQTSAICNDDDHIIISENSSSESASSDDEQEVEPAVCISGHPWGRHLLPDEKVVIISDLKKSKGKQAGGLANIGPGPVTHLSMALEPEFKEGGGTGMSEQVMRVIEQGNAIDLEDEEFICSLIKPARLEEHVLTDEALRMSVLGPMGLCDYTMAKVESTLRRYEHAFYLVGKRQSYMETKLQELKLARERIREEEHIAHEVRKQYGRSSKILYEEQRGIRTSSTPVNSFTTLPPEDHSGPHSEFRSFTTPKPDAATKSTGEVSGMETGGLKSYGYFKRKHADDMISGPKPGVTAFTNNGEVKCDVKRRHEN
ncbi:hypothetical protein RUND412_002451 [Rhizina undulata]